MSSTNLKMANPSKAWLAAEFVILYIGIPVVFQTVLHRGTPTPFLIAFGLIPFVFTFGLIRRYISRYAPADAP